MTPAVFAELPRALLWPGLAVLMGGTVRVQSKVGQGSTFIALIPLKVAESVS